MYKFVKVKYKSIMINGEDKNSVEINTNGTIHEKNGETNLYFESKEKIPFELIVKEKSLDLKQGESHLHLEVKKKIENSYQTPYGFLHLTTYLDVLELNDEGLKIKYRLFQDEECISNIYMQIRWLPVS